MSEKVLRIGCGAAFWGDTPHGAAQLVEHGALDYLVFDYLAEITMSLLARARAKDAAQGYAPDFVHTIAALAPQLAARGIKVIANAGGVNPRACQAALAEALAERGVELSIGIVLGDDLSDRGAEFQRRGTTEMFNAQAFPAACLSINAYLGASPIAAALAAGADIVITGRCVDSALVLGPLLHEFGWSGEDYDRLAQGSLAGHLIECGTQLTGGIVTDWESVCDSWDNMGFPIAECHADGSFVVTKPPGTGGLVSTATVAEQLVYEVGDPARYVLPDVICDLTRVHLEQAGTDRVRVSGARGEPPPAGLKVSATWQDGYRSLATMMIGGHQAVAKAEHVAEAILKRTRRLLAGEGHADYRRTDIEVLGAEATYGANSRARAAREVVLKLAVHHDERAALEIFAREFLPAATAMAQGITGFAGGRPGITPLIRLFSFLLEREAVTVAVEVDDAAVHYSEPAPAPAATITATPTPATPSEVLPDGERVVVPLRALAFGRSGDKGDASNIGILARRPAYVAAIRAALTADVVADYFAHLCDGPVRRYEWPGLDGFNFVLEASLGGGGTASLRYDPQGKAYAQMLLDIPVPVPATWSELARAMEPL